MTDEEPKQYVLRAGPGQFEVKGGDAAFTVANAEHERHAIAEGLAGVSWALTALAAAFRFERDGNRPAADDALVDYDNAIKKLLVVVSDLATRFGEPPEVTK